MTSTAVIPKYFCYTCEENVTNIIQNEDVIKCLNCNQEFVEIVDEEDTDQESSSNTTSNSTPNNTNQQLPFNLLQNFLGGFLNMNNQTTPPTTNNNNNNHNFVINFQVINNFAQNGRQANPQPFPNMFFNNFRSGVNLGDFAFGDMQQIIQNLVDNNRVGPPPTSKSAIDKLPEIVYHSNHSSTAVVVDDNEVKENVTNKESTEEHMNPITNCAVCKDKFLDGEVLTVLPCKHNYHRECILPWLNNANNCPICRYRLPTDDQTYEHIQQMREQQQQQNSQQSQQ